MTAQKSPATIGLFGGSFNPPHVAHVLAAAWALSTGEADEVWIIPTGGHPFGKDLAPFEDRLEMCRLTFDGYGERIRTLDIEKDDRTHYSIDTVRQLAKEHPENRWRWIIGADAIGQSEEWKDFEALKEIAPPLVIGRAGYPSRDCAFELPDISSTKIREELARSPEGETLRGLIPARALQYIRDKGLFVSNNL